MCGVFFARCVFHSPNWLSRIIHRKNAQNVSKKHANGGFSSTRFAQGRWDASESGNIRCFRCECIYTVGLDTRPLNISLVSRIIQWKNMYFLAKVDAEFWAVAHAPADHISMPPACLHDDCTVGLATKLATQPIKCKFAFVGNCQELLWKFSGTKQLWKSVREMRRRRRMWFW